ncbi:ribose-5-phosphate isomerase RpiA [Terriglobus saanensis]|uniref:Ribose-5-phosphate isomerase A n=1 Tax=Terriglobus saanensis (strain ATCC BAA-1853 / DSM 23119 / SP1PR4) TaxID=401053 RepID=E8UX17_TERSS|nr:ribose-5-phosphate isomerase RpiA [Terriglobus saanensis]ADV81904.1 ribose 5-phosphate isomerase [Terriglobus saanensis SP1PR4]
MPTQDELKLQAAHEALRFIEPGMVVGLGSGSTATLFIKLLGEKVKKGLVIRGIASSEDSAKLGAELGIPIIDFHSATEIDVTIDGADEVAPGLALIKGGGGKLLREKIVASASKKFIVVADASKLVQTLGKFPLPIEVIPMAQPLVSKKLELLGLHSKIRQAKDGSGNYITDEGNLILDCGPTVIEDPIALGEKISAITGVVEHGLFINFANLALIAGESEVKQYTRESQIP